MGRRLGGANCGDGAVAARVRSEVESEVGMLFLFERA